MTSLRVTTSGESHGPAEVCIVEGVPAGLALRAADIDADLRRRQGGYGRGGRMAIETDRCRIVAGVRLGTTLGSPICVVVDNVDHANWSTVMSPEPLDSGADATGRGRPVTVPRPGHADLQGAAKYGFNDMRNVIERASARETVGRVAGGAVCRRLLSEAGVTMRARVLRIGGVEAPDGADWCDPRSVDWEAVEQSPVGCADPQAGEAMCRAIDQAREAGESLGGVFEIWCWGMCPGVGGYATMDARLDGRLLGALCSIPAVKGAEVGAAFANAAKPGSQVHDPIVVTGGDSPWVSRETNRAGGIEGGMTTGLPVIIRAAMKPIPTLTSPLGSVDLAGLHSTEARYERSDITAVPAARIVGEAMAASILAANYLDKFGGDCLDDFLESVQRYEQRLGSRGLWRRS